jgi:hypothetical protein
VKSYGTTVKDFGKTLMNFGTLFLGCSAYAVSIYSGCCLDVAKNRLFPIVSKPSLLLEKHMSANPESKHISNERVSARSCGTPESQDIDHYFLQKGFTLDKFIDEGGRLVNSANLHALSLQANHRASNDSTRCSPQQ